MEPFAAAACDHLDINLDRITRAFLLKQLQLFRPAPPRFDQVGYADVTEDTLNRLRRDPHLVDTLQPDARAARAELVFKSRLSDQRHHVVTDPAPPPGRVLRDQPLDAGALPVSPPLPDG